MNLSYVSTQFMEHISIGMLILIEINIDQVFKSILYY